MPTGIVKWFNGRKGYGFIEPEDGGNDVFVHVTALKDSGIKFLNEGDNVTIGNTTFEILHCPGHSPDELTAGQAREVLIFLRLRSKAQNSLSGEVNT